MYVHVIILIDTSLSMGLYIDEVIYGLNKFLEKLKQKYSYNYFLTVCSFSNEMKYIVKTIKPSNINNFEVSQFNVTGRTLLYDTICQVISEFKDEKITTKMFIISDGDDNISTKYSKEETDKMIENAINIKGWQILHCNLDTSLLNIPTKIYDINDISNIFDNLYL